MQIHRDIKSLPAFKNAVVTFGSFDGVHLGHEELVTRMTSLAASVDGETVLVTFDPHPRQVIYPSDHSLQLLSTLVEKINLLNRLTLDHLVICPFTVEFSQLHADDYISNFIIDRFHPRFIMIGYDHRFGLNRSGTIDHLKSYSVDAGFDVIELEQQVTEKIQISSTRIRKYLNQGEILTANKLLGHAYQICGKVVPGQQVGEQLGYPTANIEINHPLKLVPPEGIYAARVIIDGSSQEGMLYIGTRPTITDQGKRSVEVHIFDFNEDIYGQEICLEVVSYIRADIKFKNLDALKYQLDQDQLDVQSYFETHRHGHDTTSVVILNYNGSDYLKQFLPSLARFTDDQIIVADNGSTDDSLDVLRSNFPYVDIIAMSENYGFAGGYNKAISQIQDKYLILLNSDVEVTNGWLPPLISYMEAHPNVGACQPKIKSFHDRSLFEYSGAAGGLMDRLGYPFCQGRIMNDLEVDAGQYDDIKEVFWATGAALVIRKRVFDALGGFDVDFFAHMEEIDLCWRMKQAGYRIAVVPQSVVYHVGGGTLSYQSPRKTYLNFRNGMSLLIKNEKATKLLWLLPVRVILDWVAAGRFLLVGEPQNFAAVFKSHWYSLTHLFSTWQKRAQILKQVDALRIANDNTSVGRYKGSIIWEYFVLGKRKYHELRHHSSTVNS